MKYLDLVNQCFVEESFFILARGPLGEYEIFWDRALEGEWKMKKKGDSEFLLFTLPLLKEAILLLDLNLESIKSQVDDAVAVQSLFYIQALEKISDHYGSENLKEMIQQQKDFLDNLQNFLADFSLNFEKKEEPKTPLKLIKNPQET